MIHTQLKKGDSYGKLMPVYVVCFMNFRLKHDTDKLIYSYQLRETSGEGYTQRDILNLYLCELLRFAGEAGKAHTPVEVWFDILQNMSNFATRPVTYGKKYDSIFESSLQSPIPDKDKLQYFRSMFDNDVRSYLTEEDRQEIAEEFYTKGKTEGKAEGIAKMAKAFKDMGASVDQIAKASGLSEETISKL